MKNVTFQVSTCCDKELLFLSEYPVCNPFFFVANEEGYFHDAILQLEVQLVKSSYLTFCPSMYS